MRRRKEGASFTARTWRKRDLVTPRGGDAESSPVTSISHDPTPYGSKCSVSEAVKPRSGCVCEPVEPLFTSSASCVCVFECVCVSE